jgi:hypothetical protein
MYQRWVCLFFLLVMVGCSADTKVSAQGVAKQFEDLGLITDIRDGERREGSPVPNSYKEHVEFVVNEVAPRGGQVFVCDTKRNCDALYAYFDALVAIGGPYYYQSPSGTVVAQLNSGLTPDTAAKFEAVVNALR